MPKKNKRVCFILRTDLEPDIEIIRTLVRNQGSNGSLSDVIRYALRKTANAIEGRPL
ncbi:hypothetical protein [Azospirillum sp. SYSU D00513]|uniref:hypothetical protein n=1 Tax=Azospirillum sp. SYSU D00513 TaxID=2812561 RepID=UPI001A97D19E|nr:hypothetical protein [Azospirillum sp. SYSU D00513]